MRKYHLLSYDDRKLIAERHARGERPVDIAESLGVHTATIYRELARGYNGEVYEDMRPAYDAAQSQRAVVAAIKNRGARKKSNTGRGLYAEKRKEE